MITTNFKYTVALAAMVIGSSVAGADGRPGGSLKDDGFVPRPIAGSFAGFYLGINAGYARGDSSQRSSPEAAQAIAIALSSDGQYDVGGGYLGATLGYNWAISGLLLGMEADYGLARLRGSTLCGQGTACGTEVSGSGTLRGRIGLISGSNLVYVTGGAAFADTNAFDRHDPQDGSKFRTGWTVGTGYERQLGGPLSLKVEYLYADFGKAIHFQNVGFTPENISLDVHTVRIGLNYRQGGN